MSASANIKAGRAYVEVTAETSKLSKNLKGAQAQLAAFGKSCQGLGKELMAVGGALSLPFVVAEKSFAGFDDRMRLVQAVTNSTGEAFESLTRTAQKLGRETSFTAQQVADAMIALGRMGFDPKEIEASIASVLNLSRATGTDLAESADIAANSLRIFGLEASKMNTVSDLLTATANGSAQTLTDLFEGLKMAGPQAAAAGESLDEVCASLGIMANMGIKGSLAGTALRKAYIQFADTGVQDILKSIGVEATDANGNLRKMAAVMRDVAAATKNMPTAERLSFMKDVFDIRGMMSGLSLAGNIDELDAFLAKLKDVQGQADTTAKAMTRESADRSVSSVRRRGRDECDRRRAQFDAPAAGRPDHVRHQRLHEVDRGEQVARHLGGGDGRRDRGPGRVALRDRHGLEDALVGNRHHLRRIRRPRRRAGEARQPGRGRPECLRSHGTRIHGLPQCGDPGDGRDEQTAGGLESPD